MPHHCTLPGCDGTRLGHDLAAEFPEETKRIDEAFDRLRGPREDHVMSENLTADTCTCGDPTAYSLNPAEVVVHCADGPCYIAAAEGVGGGE